MGVPALFRWLSAKYPKIVEQVIEAPAFDTGEESIPVNLLDPNPNGFEFDNLYLDMNGIIHPCCHPMDKAAPATEEAMMVEIFKYLDRIFAMIRPRRLLFMAIDGVAPRAKMNQQRSRRFRAAQERREKAERARQIKEELELMGKEEDEEEDVIKDSSETDGGNFDSNCITPGTKFMELVALSVKYYVVDRMNRVPAWKNIKVIFSDANVPGEGEHKIVDYIRRQRLDPNYDPNTRHCIYGLDADLIMLSMATHEPRFRVLREDVFWEEKVKYTPCSFCGIKGHAADACIERARSDPTFTLPPIQEKPFIFLDVAVLREYLEAELQPSQQLQYEWDLERAIDDWIFMCFFVGNDFLPHLPSLEIREGAIDLLIDIYKANGARMGGYICNNGVVNLERVQYILDDIGRVEERIFQKRHEKEERRNENIRKRQRTEQQAIGSISSSSNSKAGVGRKVQGEVQGGEGDFTKTIILGGNGKEVLDQRREANLAAAQALKIQMQNGDSKESEIPADKSANVNEPPNDDVRLWERGAKERYYQNKFHFNASDQRAVGEIVRAYVEGLCWVMAYYYQGCPSWKWFYPYHYAPLASDLISVKSLFAGTGGGMVTFEKGQPFRPFDQLMGVFPADSRELVPAPFRPLMTDPDSPVIDFYPTDFAIDLNGKQQIWQGVILLPFIEEGRLLEALEKVYPKLSPDELVRNIRGNDHVFFSLWNPVTSRLLADLNDKVDKVDLDPHDTDGLAGSIKREATFPEPGNVYQSPLIDQGCPDVTDLQVSCFVYLMPYHERKALQHATILLPLITLPPKTLTAEDIDAIKSGLASKRVPGRLILEAGGDRVGQHSMHKEYSRNYSNQQGFRENREVSPSRSSRRFEPSSSRGLRGAEVADDGNYQMEQYQQKRGGGTHNNTSNSKRDYRDYQERNRDYKERNRDYNRSDSSNFDRDWSKGQDQRDSRETRGFNPKNNGTTTNTTITFPPPIGNEQGHHSHSKPNGRAQYPLQPPVGGGIFPGQPRNPFEALMPGILPDNQSVPGMTQPAPSIFHRGPPPDRFRPDKRLESLYGRYPPPPPGSR